MTHSQLAERAEILAVSETSDSPAEHKSSALTPVCGGKQLHSSVAAELNPEIRNNQ